MLNQRHRLFSGPHSYPPHCCLYLWKRVHWGFVEAGPGHHPSFAHFDLWEVIRFPGGSLGLPGSFPSWPLVFKFRPDSHPYLTREVILHTPGSYPDRGRTWFEGRCHLAGVCCSDHVRSQTPREVRRQRTFWKGAASTPDTSFGTQVPPPKVVFN